MKKMNLAFGFLFITLLVTSSVLVADGTEPTGNPREVSTLDHLLWISTNSSSWGDNFIQTADIDASTTSSWNGGEGFSPIGNESIKFTGSYNGQNYTIDGLYINRPGYNVQALFGYTNGSTIKNLGTTNVDIKGRDFVGGLAGLIDGSYIGMCQVKLDTLVV